MSTKIVAIDEDNCDALIGVMSPEQSRAARGWLGWSQQDLAKRASVGLSTVKDFENGSRTPISNNLNAIQRALESEGIQLVFGSDGQPAGIRKS
jgi:ribosome-binding protein aMBF1 (putative translation factor)